MMVGADVIRHSFFPFSSVFIGKTRLKSKMPKELYQFVFG